MFVLCLFTPRCRTPANSARLPMASLRRTVLPPQLSASLDTRSWTKVARSRSTRTSAAITTGSETRPETAPHRALTLLPTRETRAPAKSERLCGRPFYQQRFHRPWPSVKAEIPCRYRSWGQRHPRLLLRKAYEHSRPPALRCQWHTNPHLWQEDYLPRHCGPLVSVVLLPRICQPSSPWRRLPPAPQPSRRRARATTRPCWNLHHHPATLQQGGCTPLGLYRLRGRLLRPLAGRVSRDHYAHLHFHAQARGFPLHPYHGPAGAHEGTVWFFLVTFLIL